MRKWLVPVALLGVTFFGSGAILTNWLFPDLEYPLTRAVLTAEVEDSFESQSSESGSFTIHPLHTLKVGSGADPKYITVLPVAFSVTLTEADTSDPLTVSGQVWYRLGVHDGDVSRPVLLLQGRDENARWDCQRAGRSVVCPTVAKPAQANGFVSDKLNLAAVDLPNIGGVQSATTLRLQAVAASEPGLALNLEVRRDTDVLALTWLVFPIALTSFVWCILLNVLDQWYRRAHVRAT